MTTRGVGKPATGPRVPSPVSWLLHLGPEAVLIVGAVLLSLAPALTPWLQHDRATWSDGEWWRLLTCHLVHWSPSHLLWDAGPFLVIALALGRDAYARRGAVLVCSALAIPIVVSILQPQLESYRGLSGLVSATFALLVTRRLADAVHRRDGRSIVLPAVLIALFGAKLVFELLTESAVFVDSGAGGFVAVPLAHVVGALVGAAGGLLPAARRVSFA